MIDILDSQAYLNKLMSIDRVNAQNILAFYEDRIGSICKDSKLMLAPLDDHIIHRGDGIFESISYKQGRLLQLDAHLERLKSSASGLELEAPCSYEQIREIIIQVARAGGEENGNIRLLLGRGSGGFGIARSECPKASLYIVAYRASSKQDNSWQTGLKACRSSIAAKDEYLAKLKTTNYLPNVFMDKEAKAKGVDLALSFDREGFLAEAAIANVAIINAENDFVIPYFKHTLAGTTAMKAMEILKRDGIKVYNANISEKDIFNAQELLVLGTVHECVAVVEYESRPIAKAVPGKMALMLREKLSKEIFEQGVSIF